MSRQAVQENTQQALRNLFGDPVEEQPANRPQTAPGGPETRPRGEQAPDLASARQRAEDERRKSQEAALTYQRNTKAAQGLMSEILKGTKAGEGIYSLFLKATQAISLMTGDKVFHDQVAADIAAIYGAGFREQEPLMTEYLAAIDRYDRLKEALKRGGESPDTVARIKAAIAEHEARILYLADVIDQDWYKEHGTGEETQDNQGRE